MEYQVTAGHFLTSQMWYSTQIKKIIRHHVKVMQKNKIEKIIQCIIFQGPEKKEAKFRLTIAVHSKMNRFFHSSSSLFYNYNYNYYNLGSSVFFFFFFLLLLPIPGMRKYTCHADQRQIPGDEQDGPNSPWIKSQCLLLDSTKLIFGLHFEPNSSISKIKSASFFFFK